jgi:hypothetical protein
MKDTRDLYDGPLYDVGQEIGELLEKAGYEFFAFGGSKEGDFTITLFKDGKKVEVKVVSQ